MIEIADIILENDERKILMLLRDDIPNIPFPNHWDLIGGHIEKGETPEQAVRREAKEEIGHDLEDFELFKVYDVQEGDVYPHFKHVFCGKISKSVEELVLGEGQKLEFFTYEEVLKLKLANIFPVILSEYIKVKS